MITIIKKYYFSLIIFICIVPAVVPIFQQYVSGTADGLGHRFRLVSFYNSLNQGIMRPRWAVEAALGYGAPTFLFNYPLPYYLASLFLKAGFSVNQSGQLLSAAALLLSGFAMYILGKKLTGNKVAGFVAAVVYVYAPYHLLMTYLYDAWGEILAFIFPPLIVYLILSVILNSFQDQSKKMPKQVRHDRISHCTFHFALLTIVWVLFILSHNVSAIMFAPILMFLSLVILVSDPDLIGRAHPGSQLDSGLARMTLFFVINSFILAVLISAFFWLPAFALQDEMKYPQFIAQESSMRGSFFKSFSFQLQTAINVMKEGTTHYLDFTVGLPIFFIVLFGLLSFLYLIYKSTDGARRSNFLARKKSIFQPVLLNQVILLLTSFRAIFIFIKSRMRSSKIEFCFTSSVGLLLCFYLTNYLSNWLWGLFYFHFILYPFRFLFPATFLGALLAGFFIYHYYHATVYGNSAGRVVKLIVITGFIIVSLLQGLPYTKPYIDIFPFPDNYFSQRQTVTSAPGTRKNMLIKEFLPIGADESFLNEEEIRDRREEMVITEGEGSIRVVERGSEKISARIEAKDNITVTVNRFYFPNWEIQDNGRMIPVLSDNHGRILINLNQGSHELKIVFGVSRIEKFAYIISILGIIILAGEILYLKRKINMSSPT